VNTLITYPRTGTYWTRHRIQIFRQLYTAGGRDRPNANFSHGPYHPRFHDCDGPMDILPGKWFAMMRDAKQCVVSNWHWIKTRSTLNHPDYETLEAYAVYGAKRYAHYLNWLAGLDLEDVYAYEDAGTEQFVRTEIPRLLGIDFEPDDDLVAKVMLEGAAKINLVGADHDTVPAKLLEVIDDVIWGEVRNKRYQERYLKEGL